MEKLVHAGLTKSIGVSNYSAEDIEAIKEVWTMPPAVNQVSEDLPPPCPSL
jgi:diketogulonate reductase-like aldo/keto reductase